MPSLPELPVQVAKGDVVLTANTPSDYWDYFFRGFTVEAADEQLSPQEKAARTRARNRQQEEEKTSNVPDSATDPAGNAN